MSTLRADPAQRAPGRSRAVATRSRPRPKRRWRLPKLTIGRRALVATGLLLGAGALGLAIGPFGILAGIGDAAIGLTGVAGLRVDQVMVEGRRMVDRAAVLTTLGVQRGQPILGIDIAAARARLERLTWVESAVVERRLPDLVYVRLTERLPLALWQHEGRFSVIDAKGVVVAESNVGAYANLPLVVGPGAPAKAEALLLLLATEPEVKARVAAAVRVGGRRWNLRLDNGVDVRLPEEEVGTALAKLAEINRSHQLVDRDVRVIDLRQPDRLVLQLGPNSAERLRSQAKTSQNGG